MVISHTACTSCFYAASIYLTSNMSYPIYPSLSYCLYPLFNHLWLMYPLLSTLQLYYCLVYRIYVIYICLDLLMFYHWNVVLSFKKPFMTSWHLECRWNLAFCLTRAYLQFVLLIRTLRWSRELNWTGTKQWHYKERDTVIFPVSVYKSFDSSQCCCHSVCRAVKK